MSAPDVIRLNELRIMKEEFNEEYSATTFAEDYPEEAAELAALELAALELAALERPAMDDYTAVGLAEGFIDAESEEQVIEAWQYLHDTRLAYRLQGWFGRTAQVLLSQGVIS